MDGNKAYALSKNYTNLAALGIGSMRVEGTTVYFTIIDTGEEVSVTLPVPKDGTDGTNGQDGISITNIDISSTNHLICTLSDGSEIDAGEFPTFKPVLEADLTSTTSIGSITGGKKYTKGTSLETIIRDILTTYQKPGVAVNTTPSTTLYDAVADSLSSITISVASTKGTQDITVITFYVNGVEQNKITSGVASGGTFTYKHTFSTPQQKTFSVKAEVTDGKTTVTQTKTIVFIGKSYYGLIDPDMDNITEDTIKSLNNTLKNTKTLVYSNITCDFNKVVYAYPASLGNLTAIQDEVNNFNYTDSFEKKTMDIDGISYNVYVLSEPTGADGVQITFK